MNIVFLTRSLDVGGTERQLVALAKGLHMRGHSISVVTFYANGVLREELHRAGICVLSQEKSGRWDVVRFLWRTGHVLRSLNPAAVYSFLAVPNIVSVLLRVFVPGCKWVWGVRASAIDLSNYDSLTRWTYALEARLSGFADTIICNSYAGMRHAVSRGFPNGKMRVIPNGIDTASFRPELAERRQVRDAWAVREHEILIGLVARLDPIKDHATFLRAAAQLSGARDDVRFVLVGDGPADYSRELRQLAEKLGLESNLIWAGARQDMRAVYNALDILALTSSGEGFPNVVAEAMACGVPCVTTDVGDCADIVEDRAWCVQPHDVEAFKNALEMRIRQLNKMNRDELRARVGAHFSIDSMLRSTEETISRLIEKR